MFYTFLLKKFEQFLKLLWSLYLQDGQVSYTQVLPFQWYRFNDSPDIVKVVEFFGLSNSQVDEAEKFDSQAFYHDLLEVIGAFNHAFRAKSVIPPFSATVHILKADKILVNNY